MDTHKSTVLWTLGIPDCCCVQGSMEVFSGEEEVSDGNWDEIADINTLHLGVVILATDIKRRHKLKEN